MEPRSAHIHWSEKPGSRIHWDCGNFRNAMLQIETLMRERGSLYGFVGNWETRLGYVWQAELVQSQLWIQLRVKGQWLEADYLVRVILRHQTSRSFSLLTGTILSPRIVSISPVVSYLSVGCQERVYQSKGLIPARCTALDIRSDTLRHQHTTFSCTSARFSIQESVKGSVHILAWVPSDMAVAAVRTKALQDIPSA